MDDEGWVDPGGGDSEASAAFETPRSSLLGAAGAIVALIVGALMWTTLAGDEPDAGADGASPATSESAAPPSVAPPVTAATSMATSVPSTSTAMPRSSVVEAVIDTPAHPEGRRWNAELVVDVLDALLAVDLDSGEVRELEGSERMGSGAFRVDRDGRLLVAPLDGVSEVVWVWDDGAVTERAVPRWARASHPWLVDGEVVVLDGQTLRTGGGQLLFEVPRHAVVEHVGTRSVIDTASGWVVVDTRTGEILAERGGRVIAANDAVALWQECDGLRCRDLIGPIDDPATNTELPAALPVGDHIELSPRGTHIAHSPARRVSGDAGSGCRVAFVAVGASDETFSAECPDDRSYRGMEPPVLDWTPDGAALLVVDRRVRNRHIEVQVVFAETGDVSLLKIPYPSPEGVEPFTGEALVRPRAN